MLRFTARNVPHTSADFLLSAGNLIHRTQAPARSSTIWSPMSRSKLWTTSPLIQRPKFLPRCVEGSW